jgi:prepilin-type N-terminal cleavage/methylation domain-containing protein
MKRPSNPFRKPRYHSFTLIEMLVVMGIIAILAGVLFPAISAAINSAKRAQANNMVNQISTSVLGYYTEYSVYPLTTNQITAATDVYIASNQQSDWQPLIIALCGNVNPYSPGTAVSGNAVANTRAIPFLNLRKSDIDSSGIPVNPISPAAAGNKYYNIAIDGDYNGILSNLPTASLPTTTTNVITGGVAVWANCNASFSSTNAAFWVHTY